MTIRVPCNVPNSLLEDLNLAATFTCCIVLFCLYNRMCCNLMFLLFLNRSIHINLWKAILLCYVQMQHLCLTWHGLVFCVCKYMERSRLHSENIKGLIRIIFNGTFHNMLSLYKHVLNHKPTFVYCFFWENKTNERHVCKYVTGWL